MRERRRPDPSPVGEGGRAAAGWGGKRTSLGVSRARALRKRMTRHEVKLWNWLREAIEPTGFHMRRQVPIDRFIVDFACLAARLVIEVDGEQHGSDVGRARDSERDLRLAELAYRVLRFTNRDIDREKHVVLATIDAALSAFPGSPRPAGRPHPAPAAPPSPAGEGSVVEPGATRPSAPPAGGGGA